EKRPSLARCYLTEKSTFYHLPPLPAVAPVTIRQQVNKCKDLYDCDEGCAGQTNPIHGGLTSQLV
ncbi:hypothetical protein QTP86_021217, partial [Hemibagrus guttatus]